MRPSKFLVNFGRRTKCANALSWTEDSTISSQASRLSTRGEGKRIATGLFCFWSPSWGLNDLTCPCFFFHLFQSSPCNPFFPTFSWHNDMNDDSNPNWQIPRMQMTQWRKNNLQSTGILGIHANVNLHKETPKPSFGAGDTPKTKN